MTRSSGHTAKLLVKHLKGGEAFMTIDEMLGEIKFELLGNRPNDLPYSFYELFYHIWFTQKDILEYCTQRDYSAPQWPKDYWPNEKAPANRESWEKLKNRFFSDREELSGIILEAKDRLTESVPSNSDHSLLREILLVIEHTSYHSGQLLIVLRHLGLHSTED